MIVALAACAILSSSTAFAGGPNAGTKSDPIIRVSNGSGGPIAAFINPDPAKIAAIPVPVTPQGIEKAGGKIVNSGQHVDFKVKKGANTVAAGVDPLTAPAVAVNAQSGEYKYLYTSLVQLLPYQ